MLGAAPARVGVRARCPAHGRRRRAAWHAVVSLRDVLRLVAAPDDRCEAPSRCGPARKTSTHASARSPRPREKDSSRDRPAAGTSRARPPAAPRRRREPTRLLFFILVCFVLFWCSPRESIEWFVAAMASSFLSGGVVCTLLSRRVRELLRHQCAIAAIEATRPSTRVLPKTYVMHRLYTQGLVVGMLWSGAPDVVARATHRRSALELGARPTGNWRRGAAGLNSPCGESPAAASGAVGRDRRGDRRGRRAAGVKLSW